MPVSSLVPFEDDALSVPDVTDASPDECTASAFQNVFVGASGATASPLYVGEFRFALFTSTLMTWANPGVASARNSDENISATNWKWPRKPCRTHAMK